MASKMKLGVQGRLYLYVGTISVLVGLVLLIGAFVVDARTSKKAERRLTAVVSLTSAALQNLDDSDAGLTEFEGADGVLGAVVLDSGGRRHTSWGEHIDPDRLSEATETPVEFDGQVLSTQPVSLLSGEGIVAVLVSAELFPIGGNGLVGKTLLLELFLGVMAVISVIMTSRLIVNPMAEIAKAARLVTEGDLQEIPIDGAATSDVVKVLYVLNELLTMLREVSQAADRVAEGDLTVSLEFDGPLASSFNRLVFFHRNMVREIASSAAQLASAAAQIYAASQEQEAAATQQSSGVEEVSRTMQSLLESAAHISDAARGVLSNAERTKETNDLTASKIEELSGHTNRIAEILEVIRDIADRSDLLALNASLEGTRAGEAGRSFSLVASEMRRLAERVTASVKDIKVLVADVRSSGSSTIMATEEARKLAESTTESARQITMVTQQQRTGTEQVSDSMTDLSDLLIQSVAASQETRSLAEDLKRQADALAEIVSRFTLQVDSGVNV